MKYEIVKFLLPHDSEINTIMTDEPLTDDGSNIDHRIDPGIENFLILSRDFRYIYRYVNVITKKIKPIHLSDNEGRKPATRESYSLGKFLALYPITQAPGKHTPICRRYASTV